MPSIIRKILGADDRVRFAYLYGSVTEGKAANDIDIAVYAADGANPFELSADLKIALYEASGLAPDLFDIRIINELVEKGDLFSLLYLRRVLQTNLVIVDKDESARTDFIESFSLKYRECEGLIDEVLTEVRIDLPRIKRYLMEITKNADDLNRLVNENELEPDSLALKAAKYILIELAEAMSNTIQHILAKQQGIAVAGYIDTIVKAHQRGIVSAELFRKLKPFFDFRNSLIHRYWTIDDVRLIQNMRMGRGDFMHFVEEIEKYLAELQ